MCLTVNRYFSKRYAFRDIIVYKCLYKSGIDYYTYYRNAKVEIPSQVFSKIEKYPSCVTFFKIDIERALHSFAKEKACRQTAAYRDKNVVIVKCIIPKGSIYYVGEFAHYKSYASDKLNYVEIISGFLNG